VPVKPMRDAMKNKRVQPWIAKQDLQPTLGRRILSLDRLYLLTEPHR